jgi:hypothetical protein
MIPSANSDSLDRLPPEKRFRKPRIEFPEKFCSISFTVSMSTPGAGM